MLDLDVIMACPILCSSPLLNLILVVPYATSWRSAPDENKTQKMYCFRNIHADPWFFFCFRCFKPTIFLSKFSCLVNFILWHSKHLQGHFMSNHQTIHKNLTHHLRNGWNLVCMFSLRCWTTTKFYFIRTSIAQDIGHW